MSFEVQRVRALEILAHTGMRSSNYEPPLVKLLWRYGVNVRPPHFASFWANALWTGLWFGLAWGVLMSLVTALLAHLVYARAVPLVLFVAAAVFAGAAFGLAMATYYAYGRRKYNLPSWQSLANG